VGLEVGNSIYFDAVPSEFAYWNTDDAGREMVRRLIRSGHIDCLHSYGDLAIDRSHAGRALDELERHDCRVQVWIDHRVAPTNFGADIMQGHGDERGHEAYHADLTIGFGVRYVWRGRVTSVIGQDAPARVGGLLTRRAPLKSASTLAKELVKHALGRCGNSKYQMHAPNDVLRPTQLRDGHEIHEFLRANPHWGGVSSCDTGRQIGNVLTDDFLRRLVDREGACVLYTHLGKGHEPRTPFDQSAAAAFSRLADAQREGRVLVTTTRRLLGYCRAVRQLSWSVRHDEPENAIEIAIELPRGCGLCESDLDGMTFSVPAACEVRITIDGRAAAGVIRNPPDPKGRMSVSLPWRRLELPDV